MPPALCVSALAARAVLSCRSDSMQPAQLRKLNRGPALGRDTTNFSIPDPDLPDDGFEELSLGEDPFQTTVQ